MSHQLEPAEFGEPALRIAGFQLWVHSRRYDDGYIDDWLRVTAHCGASGASVWTDGEILLLSDIATFGDECASLARGEQSTVVLHPFEPNLKVIVETRDRLGHIGLRVEITPDHMTQRHTFEFDIDQTYLAGIVRECAAIVAKFGVPRPDADTRT